MLRKKEKENILSQVVFDIISDKISIAILRLAYGQGETISPKEIMAKVKISSFFKLENVGLFRVGESLAALQQFLEI